VLCRLTNNILSTGQQVWLQKLGGAKNPVRQVPDDIIKNDRSQVQKSISKLNSTIAEEASQSAKTSEGPQPGDRLVVIGSYTHCICHWFIFICCDCTPRCVEDLSN